MPKSAGELYEQFKGLLKPFRETNLTTTDERVTWLFASEASKLEVTFDSQEVAAVNWQLLKLEGEYDVAPSGNVSLSLENSEKVQKLVDLVKPVHDAIAQERAYDTVRPFFPKTKPTRCSTKS
jgi:hypothetical protein